MDLFLEDLSRTLKAVSESASDSAASVPSANLPLMSHAAARHGRALLGQGFTIDEVVLTYGDMRRAIVDVATDLDITLSARDSSVLDRCLDGAVASSVMEYSSQRDILNTRRQHRSENERLGDLAHELRNHLYAATLAFAALKEGVDINGPTGAVLSRSLIAMRGLIDRSLADVRIAAGVPPVPVTFSLADFIAELKVVTSFEARVRGCGLEVEKVPSDWALSGDRDLLFSAAANLLQNGFKFTRPRTAVKLRAREAGQRVLIEVADQCGGLPPHAAESIFAAFVQAGQNKSGLGLGLSIAKRSIESSGGTLQVTDIPGTGCIFTIDLPLYKLADKKKESAG